MGKSGEKGRELLMIVGGVVVLSLSWKGDDEGGETLSVVIIIKPVCHNVGERGGRGSNDDKCERGGRVVVVVIKGGG